ncbi:hypothetical protein BDQ12DRAFT_668603 [Crucibulum laeve]|uniref:Uncharacterized protein n=1 Tax=Crucibulum laeve TaxID=68775 RepID=A0A5C3LT82_9AGAR|nr:hypothetical protein BDQ12DRAFT_668603 [Crucibulum laeve]
MSCFQGTAQFMAIAILLRCLKAPGVENVIHSLHHDLEAIIWVALYSILMHEIIEERGAATFSAGCNKDDDKFHLFRDSFSHTSYKEIEKARKYCMTSSELLVVMIKAPALQKLVSTLMRLVCKQNNSWSAPIYITHQSLRAAFDDACKGL